MLIALLLLYRSPKFTNARRDRNRSALSRIYGRATRWMPEKRGRRASIEPGRVLNKRSINMKHTNAIFVDRSPPDSRVLSSVARFLRRCRTRRRSVFSRPVPGASKPMPVYPCLKRAVGVRSTPVSVSLIIQCFGIND